MGEGFTVARERLQLMITRMAKRRAAIRRMEESIADLLNAAEQWTLTGSSLYDIRNRRVQLLAAARSYARCLAAARQ